VLQHEVEKQLLLAAETGVDGEAGLLGAGFAGDGRQGIGHVGEHVEEITLLS
jgi:hypothetical protein